MSVTLDEIESMAEALQAGLILFGADDVVVRISRRARQQCGLALGDSLEQARAQLGDAVQEIPLGDHRGWLLPAPVLDDQSVIANFATLSHEVRTPISAILGMTELLGDTELSAAQSRYTGILSGAASSLLQLVNNLLDLQQMGAGRLEIAARNFYLHEVIDAALEVNAVRAHRKGLELAAHVEPGTPTYLVGDPDRLRQIIINLVTNAVKFTTTGAITVRTTLRDHPATLDFVVEDSGPGVPPERQPHLFTPYWQLHDNAVEGSGLGLSISKQLATAMGGDLWYEPSPGGGSRFCFSARFGEQESPERQTISLPTEAMGMRVLIVEGNPDVGAAAVAILADWGAVPELATTAEEAEARMASARGAAPVSELRPRRTPYGAVIIDADLEPTGGFVVAKAVMRESADVPVVMLLSSRSLSEGIAAVEQLGAWGGGFIVKPIKRDELLHALNRARGVTTTTNKVRTPIAAESRARVMVVDDDETNRLFLETVLSGAGCQVQTFATGEAALEALRADPRFDIALSDIQMRGMDGYQLVANVRAFEAEIGRPRLPMVALTGLHLDGHVRACLAAGFDAHLAKPVSRVALLELVGTYATPPSKAEVRHPALSEIRMALVRRDYDGIAIAARRLSGDVDPAIAQVSQRLIAAAGARDRAMLKTLVAALADAMRSPEAETREIEEAVRPLLPSYLKHRMEDVRALERSLDEGDVENIAYLGHRMAGSGSSYGFPEVTRIGLSLEREGNARSIDAARPLVAELREFLEGLPSSLAMPEGEP